MYRCFLCTAPLIIREVTLQDAPTEQTTPGKRKRKRKHKNNTPPICCDVCGGRIAEKIVEVEEERTIMAV